MLKRLSKNTNIASFHEFAVSFIEYTSVYKPVKTHNDYECRVKFGTYRDDYLAEFIVSPKSERYNRSFFRVKKHLEDLIVVRDEITLACMPKSSTVMEIFNVLMSHLESK